VHAVLENPRTPNGPSFCRDRTKCSGSRAQANVPSRKPVPLCTSTAPANEIERCPIKCALKQFEGAGVDAAKPLAEALLGLSLPYGLCGRPMLTKLHRPRLDERGDGRQILPPAGEFFPANGGRSVDHPNAKISPRRTVSRSRPRVGGFGPASLDLPPNEDAVRGGWPSLKVHGLGRATAQSPGPTGDAAPLGSLRAPPGPGDLPESARAASRN